MSNRTILPAFDQKAGFFIFHLKENEE